MNVAMTVISLILIEKAGRKTLMLSGLGGMLVCTTCLLICLIVKVRIRCTFNFYGTISIIVSDIFGGSSKKYKKIDFFTD